MLTPTLPPARLCPEMQTPADTPNPEPPPRKALHPAGSLTPHGPLMSLSAGLWALPQAGLHTSQSLGHQHLLSGNFQLSAGPLAPLLASPLSGRPNTLIEQVDSPAAFSLGAEAARAVGGAGWVRGPRPHSGQPRALSPDGHLLPLPPPRAFPPSSPSQGGIDRPVLSSEPRAHAPAGWTGPTAHRLQRSSAWSCPGADGTHSTTTPQHGTPEDKAFLKSHSAGPPGKGLLSIMSHLTPSRSHSHRDPGRAHLLRLAAPFPLPSSFLGWWILEVLCTGNVGLSSQPEVESQLLPLSQLGGLSLLFYFF